jgi:hypothetical protein
LKMKTASLEKNRDRFFYPINKIDLSPFRDVYA